MKTNFTLGLSLKPSVPGRRLVTVEITSPQRLDHLVTALRAAGCNAVGSMTKEGWKVDFVEYMQIEGDLATEPSSI